MRYHTHHKEKTHQRIVEAASQEFRTHGFEGVGIAKLMGALSLTHGGFYAHFADKEELVAEALALALAQSREAMLSALKTGGLPALLDYYLSEEHRDHPARGCPLPALAAEVARRPSSRAAFTEKLSEISSAVAEHLPGQTRARNIEKAGVMLAAMVGAVSLARAVSDPVLSKALLRATRDHLRHFLDEPES